MTFCSQLYHSVCKHRTLLQCNFRTRSNANVSMLERGKTILYTVIYLTELHALLVIFFRSNSEDVEVEASVRCIPQAAWTQKYPNFGSFSRQKAPWGFGQSIHTCEWTVRNHHLYTLHLASKVTHYDFFRFFTLQSTPRTVPYFIWARNTLHTIAA